LTCTDIGALAVKARATHEQFRIARGLKRLSNQALVSLLPRSSLSSTFPATADSKAHCFRGGLQGRGCTAHSGMKPALPEHHGPGDVLLRPQRA
jgi:hypothetical protein